MEEINTFTSNHNETICPYCGDATEHYESETLPWEEDEETELYCDTCDKEYIVTCSVMYSRESFRIKCEDKKHNLGEIEEGVSQELADRWNRENFLDRNNHKPTKIRKCLDCDYEEDVND